MVVQLSQELFRALDERARSQGRDLNELVDEAVREYLVSSSITDVTPEEIAASQLLMAAELEMPPYDAARSPREAR